MTEDHKIDVRNSTIDKTLELLNELGIEVEEVEQFPQGVRRDYDFKTNIHFNKGENVISVDFKDKDHMLPTYDLKVYRSDFDLFQNTQTFYRLKDLQKFMYKYKRELLCLY